MRFGFLGWSLAGFAAATAAATHDGVKIVARETFPAGTREATTYVAGDRVREESRIASQLSVLIHRCDLNRLIVLNSADRSYQARPLEMPLTALERFTLSLGRSTKQPESPANLVIETRTVDTGDRKMAFGYSARRVLTTRTQLYAGQPGASQQTVTDGWYIDLETRPTCERSQRAGGRAVLIGLVSPAGTRPSVPRVTFKDIGPPEEGFAIEAKLTSRSFDQNGREVPPSLVTHTVVTHVSRQSFESSLFEVPEGYRSADGIFDRLGARVGRTMQIVRSVAGSWWR